MPDVEHMDAPSLDLVEHQIRADDGQFPQVVAKRPTSVRMLGQTLDDRDQAPVNRCAASGANWPI